MVYSDTTTKLGIIEQIDFTLFGSSTANITDYPLADKVRSVNKWYRTVMGWIFGYAGNWSFDDANYTNLPIAQTDCVTGQKDYSFPTDYVEIEAVHYKDASGIWHTVQPIDRSEIDSLNVITTGVIGGAVAQASEEFLKPNGTPLYYDKAANSFILYPAPDRTSTDGNSLRVYYTRDAANTGTASVAGGPFISTDTTKEPGFNRLWHPVLAYGAAYEYCIANSRTDKMQVLNIEIERYKMMVQEHYSRRRKDERDRLVPAWQNNR